MYATHTAHPLRFVHSNDVFWVTTGDETAVPVNFPPLRPKHFPQHPALKHPPVFVLPSGRQTQLTPIKGTPVYLRKCPSTLDRI